MCQLSPIAFHDDTIFCVVYEDQPYIPMRPIVENLGLDWSAQAAKFRANKDRWTVAIITTVAQDGLEREMLCIPIRKYPAWLTTLNPNKVKPELRPKIELYQAESDDALWNYWMNGRAERKPEPMPDIAPNASLTPDQQCTLRAIVKSRVEAIPEAERYKGIYPQIWSRFNNHFRIAKYSQLPQSKMAEAVEYLVKLEVREKKELPSSQPLFPSALKSNIPGPQPGDKYYAYLEKVEKWRLTTVTEREKLFREGVAFLDAGRMGGEIFHVCADYLSLWLKKSVLESDTSVFDELLGHNRAPVVLIKFLNTNFEDVRKYLK